MFPRLYPEATSARLWDGGNSTYLYGRNTGSSPANAKLWRRDKDGDEVEVFDFSSIDDDNFTNDAILHQVIPFDDVLFVDLRTAANLHFLYRSNDGGATWSESLKVGNGSGTHYANSSVLGTRGLCEATIDSGKKYIVGEYNTRGTTDGSEDGAVLVLQSTDDGATWTTVIKWNTQGAFNNVNHVHAVLQDPYERGVYICLGDNTNSGIIQWDGSTDISALNDTALVDGASGSGYKVFAGSKKFQTTDLIFTRDWVLNPVDNLNTSGVDDGAQGVWRFPRDFGSYVRVSNLNAQFAYHNLYWGATDGRYNYACEIINGSATGKDKLQSYIYASDRTTGNWAVVGKIILANTFPGGGPSGFTWWNGQLILAWNQVAGRSDWTYFYRRDGFVTNHDADGVLLPEVLAPIAWVETTGTDSVSGNTGYAPETPWATVKYACTPNNFVQGGRILVGEGDWTSDQIEPGFSTIGNATNVFGTTFEAPTVIEGKGHTRTRIALASGSADNTFILIDADGTADGNGNYPGDEPVRFVNIHVDSDKTDGTTIIVDTDINDHALVEFYRCRVGDSTKLTDRTIRYSGAQRMHIFQSIIEREIAAINSGDGQAILMNRANGELVVTGGVIMGGDYCARNGTAGVKMRFYGTVFYGYDIAAINQFASSTLPVTAIGCVSKPLASASDDFYQEGASIDIPEVAYNVHPNANMVTGSGTATHPAVNVYASIDPDTVLEDIAAGNYTPLTARVGGHGAMRFDFNGAACKNPCNVGPVEFQPGVRVPALSRALAVR